MSKVIKEFLLEEQSGTVNIEFEDNSTISFNLADAVTSHLAVVDYLQFNTSSND